VHIGHYGSIGLLDRLARSAPVLATTTTLDSRMSAEAIATTHAGVVGGMARVIEAGPIRIGVTFDLSKPEDPPLVLEGRPLADHLAERFGGPVDVVAYANTHIDRVTYAQGVLMVNPGSPNIPGGDRKGGLGTVAVLSIQDGLTTVEIVDLEREKRAPNEDANA
jgi:predicted phosphodiesterase